MARLKFPMHLCNVNRRHNNVIAIARISIVQLYARATARPDERHKRGPPGYAKTNHKYHQLIEACEVRGRPHYLGGDFVCQPICLPAHSESPENQDGMPCRSHASRAARQNGLNQKSGVETNLRRTKGGFNKRWERNSIQLIRNRSKLGDGRRTLSSRFLNTMLLTALPRCYPHQGV